MSLSLFLVDGNSSSEISLALPSNIVPGSCLSLQSTPEVTEFRISLKLNISAAREQQTVGLGPLVKLHDG